MRRLEEHVAASSHDEAGSQQRHIEVRRRQRGVQLINGVRDVLYLLGSTSTRPRPQPVADILTLLAVPNITISEI